MKFTITVVNDNEFNEGWLAYILGESQRSVVHGSNVYIEGWKVAAETPPLRDVRVIFERQRDLAEPQYVVELQS